MAKHGVVAVLVGIAFSQLLGCGAPSREFVADDVGFTPPADTGVAIDTSIPDTNVADTGAPIGETDIDSSSGETEIDSTVVDGDLDALVVDTGVVDSGSIDAPPMDTGPTTSVNTGIRNVSGGMTTSNTKYRLITTTGQVPGNSVISGSKFILKGGVVGVTQP